MAGGPGNERGIVHGAPELVVEVAQSGRYLDLGPKRAEYERAGVLEYVVRLLEPDEVRRHVLRDRKLVAVPPDADGMHKSAAFPGLWLDPLALLAGATRRLRAVVDRGRETAEHAAFVAQLGARRG